MNTDSFYILMLTTMLVGLIHTLLGPDHYVPFVALSRVSKWNLKKTLWITAFCGLGHVLSSVVLGFVGISFGFALTQLKSLESTRGNLATWFLIAFGLVYMIWGIRCAYRHDHPHAHGQHMLKVKKKSPVGAWILFLVFVFGPCEPLIPLMMYGAASFHFFAAIMISVVFGLITILTMMISVAFLWKGSTLIPDHIFGRFGHALMGFVILLCSVFIKVLGV